MILSSYEFSIKKKFSAFDMLVFDTPQYCGENVDSVDS